MFEDCEAQLLVLIGSDVSQENISHIITPPAACTIDSRKFVAVYAVYARFWPHHQHVATEVWLSDQAAISLVHRPVSSHKLTGPEGWYGSLLLEPIHFKVWQLYF